MRQFFQPPPAAGDEALLLTDVSRIELAFIKRTFDGDGLKFRIDDKLGQRRIAADVALARRMQRFGIDLANDVAEVEIAVPDVLDVAAADIAEVTFFTLG